MGRWSLFRSGAHVEPADDAAEFVARQLLARTGVVFRRTVERERMDIRWFRLLRALRTLEVRGEVRGGRFVAGFSGEQFAHPEAVRMLRAVRREGADARVPVHVEAADPLNFVGILTPDARVAGNARRQVAVA
jgi:ATP-dependent Lhr-like helicase